MTALPDTFQDGRRASPGAATGALRTSPPDLRDRIYVPWPLAIYFIAILLPIRFWAGPVMLTSVRVVLLVATLPLLVNLLCGRYGRLILPDFVLIAHLVWMFVSLSQTTPELALSQTGSLGAEFLGGYLMARAFVRSHAQFLGAVRFLSVAILMFLPVAFFEMKTGDSPILRIFDALPGIQSYGLVDHEPRLGFERAQIVFEHPIHWGLFASSMFSLVCIGMTARLPIYLRALLAGGVGIATFSSLSSGALMPLILQIGLITWALLTKRIRGRWIIFSSLAALAYVVVDLLSNRTPIQVFFSYATFSPHTAYWRGIIFDWGMSNIFGSVERNIPSARLFGIGFADWVRPWFMYSGSMDNFWLVMGVRHGVLGFMTVAVPYAWMMVRVGRKSLTEHSEVWYLRRAWMFTMLSLALTLATVHIWTAIYSYVFFLIGAGAWFISYKEPEQLTPTASGTVERTATVYSRFSDARPASGSERKGGSLTRYRRGEEPAEDHPFRAVDVSFRR